MTTRGAIEQRLKQQEPVAVSSSNAHRWIYLYRPAPEKLSGCEQKTLVLEQDHRNLYPDWKSSRLLLFVRDGGDLGPYLEHISIAFYSRVLNTKYALIFGAVCGSSVVFLLQSSLTR